MAVGVLTVHSCSTSAERIQAAVQESGLDSFRSTCSETACQSIHLKRPDLVLLDADLLLQQPDLCRRFRAACPESYLPIILIIPHDGQEIHQYLCAGRVDDYICQPFSDADLQARIMLRLSGYKKKSVHSLPEIDFDFLAGLSGLAVADLDTAEILQRVVGSITEVIDVRRCSITMIREDADVGYVLASSDDSGVNGLRIELDKYPEIQETIRSGRPLLIEDIYHHPLMETVLPYIEKLGFDSIMVLPMIDRRRTAGVLVLRTARSSSGFTTDEISFCQMVANLAVSALRAAELRRTELAKDGAVVLATDDDSKNPAIRERSALLGMAAHDLRVLVSVVDGYCLLLSEASVDNLSVEQDEIMNGLMVGSRRLVDMANNLLDYSRIEAGRFEMKMEMQDICTILKTAQSEILPLLQKRSICMEVNYLGENVPVPCDEEGIRRVFYNIVTNALKFTPDGGSIKLSLTVTDHEVKVTIEDSGPGIEPGILSRLFDEYVCSAGPDGQMGNGLGLSICKKIIEAHHGRIWAESSLGQGSLFTFCLPK